MKKVIDIEERIPSMRERRKKRANRKFFFVVSLFVIALLLVLYFQSQLSKIDDIKVTGAYLHEKDYYIEKSGLGQGDKLWGFTKKNVKQRLEQVDGVKAIEIERRGLRDVAISLEEWKPIAYVENDDKYGILLENGTVFIPEKLLLEEDAPILNGFIDGEVQSRISTQLNNMEDSTYQLISEIIYTGTEDEPDRITVYMNDGYEVKALLTTFSEKMAYYSEIVAQLSEEEKGVIDMEVGTFFTPYSQVYGVGEIDYEDDNEDVEGIDVEEEGHG